jgi:nucleotide-binding universal stress UspA family protein
MKEIKQLIIPIDFQKHTDDLVDYALYIASKFDAAITFFHVVEQLDNYAGFVHPSWEQYEKDMLIHAEERMRNLITDTKEKGVDCSGKVKIGDIVDSIITFTKECNGDAIVMGTHGRKGFEKILLGSVAERVIKKAPCPVMLRPPYTE